LAALFYIDIHYKNKCPHLSKKHINQMQFSASNRPRLWEVSPPSTTQLVAKASVLTERKSAPVSWSLAVTSPAVPESAENRESRERRDAPKRDADPENEDAKS
jgi:hypothetical protein